MSASTAYKIFASLPGVRAVREIQQDLQDDDCTVWSAEVWVDGAWCGPDSDEHYREGAEIRTHAGDAEVVRHIPALPAQVVDATGAGDVFATALILAMRAGDDVAGRLAAACAAACVERPGSAPLPTRAELITRAGLQPADLVPAGLGAGAQGDRP